MSSWQISSHGFRLYNLGVFNSPREYDTDVIAHYKQLWIKQGDFERFRRRIQKLLCIGNGKTKLVIGKFEACDPKRDHVLHAWGRAQGTQ